MINVSPSILINLAITMAASFILFMFMRNIKSRVDNKMEAMFQLVQAMATEVSTIKFAIKSKDNPISPMDPSVAETDNSKIAISESESDESGDSDDSDNESNTMEEEETEALKIISNVEDITNIKGAAEIPNILSNSDKETSDEESNNSSEEDFEIEEIKTINITDIGDTVEPTSEDILSPSSVNNSEVNTIHLEDDVIDINSELIQEAALDKLNVKELREKVVAAGGKPGKMNKGDLIEYLQANT